MHTNGKVTIALVIAVGLSACSESSVAPRAVAPTTDVAAQSAKSPSGTGLILDNVTGVSVPVIGQPNVTLNQAVITQLGVVQDLAGNIVGVSATGALQLTGGALGSDIVTQNFTGDALVLSSSGHGQCDIVTIDLAPVAIDALGQGISVDVPQASVTPRASGALGPLLCNLGSALNAPVGQISTAVKGLVNAINQILI